MKHLNFCQTFAGGLRVQHDLGLQGIQRIKTDFVPDVPQDFHPNGLTVQVAVEVQNPGFHGYVGPVVDRGAGAHVGDGGVTGAVGQEYPGGINTVAGNQYVAVRLTVGMPMVRPMRRPWRTSWVSTWGWPRN